MVFCTNLLHKICSFTLYLHKTCNFAVNSSLKWHIFTSYILKYNVTFPKTQYFNVNFTKFLYFLHSMVGNFNQKPAQVRYRDNSRVRRPPFTPPLGVPTGLIAEAGPGPLVSWCPDGAQSAAPSPKVDWLGGGGALSQRGGLYALWKDIVFTM